MHALDDQVAWITGSSRGIGAGIARLFAQEGATVVLHGRDTAALASVQREIERAGGRVTAVTADVTKFDEIERARAFIEETVGPIDILVANAGGNVEEPRLIEDSHEDAWRATVDSNLTATFLCLKSVLPGMKRRNRGAIVTLSSAAARRPNARSPIAYAAAKAGIELLTQDVAGQIGPHHIRINCIAPETILTEQNQVRISDDQKRLLADTRPLRRLGTPDDVAHAALFLVSDASAWITGVVLDVAGGSVLAR
jgi:3-oxoacyl-[acyl-carrier protein] reductase